MDRVCCDAHFAKAILVACAIKFTPVFIRKLVTEQKAEVYAINAITVIAPQGDASGVCPHK